MDVTAGGVALLACAGFAGGAINAAAGGGTLVTFPALLAVGLSPLSANVTNTVGLSPGYLGGAVGHQRTEPLPEIEHRPLAMSAVVGAAVGVALLLVSPSTLFERVAPFLVLIAVVLLLAQQPILHAMHRRGVSGGPRAVLSAAFIGGAYGAYFGAALGVLLLALFSITSRAAFPLANAVKTRLAFVINLIAAIAYAVLAPVEWWAALVVAVSSTGGGYLGGRLARRIPVLALRLLTAALGAVAFVVLVI